MHVTLIRPVLGRGYRTPARMEPSALAILAALTPRPAEVTAVDERFERLDLDCRTDLVAMSVCTFSALRAYEISAEYRRRGVPVVLGGPHPTLVPEEAQEHADAVVVGDAEASWPALLADFGRGALRARYAPAEPGPSMPAMPDRSVFRGKRYLPLRLIQTGRGCPRACEFCSVRAFYGGRHIQRPVESVMEEIERSRARRVFFTDDNILSSREHLVALMEALVGRGIRWITQVDLSFADDAELLSLAARSGCQSVVVGIESLDEENLQQMHKAWSTAKLHSERLGRLRDAGIMVYGSFVVGYDHDGPETFQAALEFAIREKLCIANFSPLQPLPGTPLYARLAAEGRLVRERWWTDPAYRWHDALLRPLRMTPEELTAGCARSREAFHSLRSMLQRFRGSRANAGLNNALTFWVANLVSRLDIRAKTHLALGSRGAAG